MIYFNTHETEKLYLNNQAHSKAYLNGNVVYEKEDGNWFAWENTGDTPTTIRAFYTTGDSTTIQYMDVTTSPIRKSDYPDYKFCWFCLTNDGTDVNLKRIRRWDDTYIGNMRDMGIATENFNHASNLIKFPMIGKSQKTNFYSYWSYDSKLTSFPAIDTSDIKNMEYTWNGCSGLTSFPSIDTSNVTNMRNTWEFCSALNSFPLIDTSNVEDMYGAWYGCKKLTSFPAINTSNVRNMNTTWSMCKALERFEGSLDCSKIAYTTSISGLTATFLDCNSLTGITFTGSINTPISFLSSPLSADSIKSILTACSKADNTEAKTLTFKVGTTVTDDASGTFQNLVNVCVSKGWTVANLIINPA